MLEARATAGLWLQAQEPRSRPEAQCPESLADQAHRAFLLLVAHLDLHVIGAANAGNSDHDLSRVTIRTILGEAATSRDDGSKLGRIQEPPPNLLHGGGERDFSTPSQRTADGCLHCSGLRRHRARCHVMAV